MTKKAINLLAKGYAEEFVQYIQLDDMFIEWIMEYASKFVEENIGIVDEDAASELAFQLVERVRVSAS